MTSEAPLTISPEVELKVVSEGRFCIGCEYIATTGSGDPATFRCFAPQNLDSKTLNLVTGRYDKHWIYSNAYTARQAPAACGLEGKWWEKKKEEPPLRAMDDRGINKENKGKKSGSISADDL